MSNPTKQDAIKLLDVFDPEMATLLHREEKRQFETIGLIASENVVSPMASCLEGSAFTNKNTEGYAGKLLCGRLPAGRPGRAAGRGAGEAGLWRGPRQHPVRQRHHRQRGRAARLPQARATPLWV